MEDLIPPKRGEVVALAALVGVLVSVAIASPPSQMAAKDEFFPLSLGNSWVYEAVFDNRHYRVTQTVVREEIVTEQRKVAYVVRENYEPMDGRSPQAFSTVAYVTKEGFLYRYPWLDSEGERIWSIVPGEKKETLFPSNLSSSWPKGYRVLAGGIAEKLFPNPFTGEAEWESPLLSLSPTLPGTPPGTLLSARFRVRIDLDEIEVGAGTFRNCLRVEAVAEYPRRTEKPIILHYIDWYARGVGLVKGMCTEENGTSSTRASTELLAVRLHAPAKQPKS